MIGDGNDPRMFESPEGINRIVALIFDSSRQRTRRIRPMRLEKKKEEEFSTNDKKNDVYFGVDEIEFS